MKKLFLIFVLFISNILYSQVKESDYFKFYKEDIKRLKPIKYLLFDSLKEKKIANMDKVFYYIQGERFVFSNKKYKTDTCSIEYLKKVKIETGENLAEAEIEFFRNTIPMEKYDEAGVSPPFPIAKIHPFFKIYLLEKTKDNKLIKREVDWEFSR